MNLNFGSLRKIKKSAQGEYYLYEFNGLYKLAIEGEKVAFLDNIKEEAVNVLLAKPTTGRKINVLLFQESENPDHWLKAYSPEVIPVMPQHSGKLKEFFEYQFPVNKKGETKFSEKEIELLSILTEIYNPLRTFNIN